MFSVSCSCIWFCLVVSCIWFPCLCIMSCCVSCFVFPCPHVSFKFPCVFPLLNCPLSVSYVLPSVSLCLSVFSSMPHYLTCWSTSPVPRLVVSVCVFSLCLPCSPSPVVVCMCQPLSAPAHVSVPSSPWYVFLNFCILIWTLVLICTLPYFLCTLFHCCFVATLSFIPVWSVFGFLVQFEIKAHFLFTPFPASWDQTEFGSNSYPF